jgi:3-phosphoshikimate 1-carboxyvinyltransferase
MKATIQTSHLKGNIQAPASKSSMQRACAAALLRKGKTEILNPGNSNDDKAAIEIIRALGAVVTRENEYLLIESNGSIAPKQKNAAIHCGESGLGIRMFTPIAALSINEITITGEGSLLSRPMDFFDAILPRLGVKIRSNDGKLPIVIQGPLQPQDIEIDGSLSSQFLTGLLMAYAGAGAHSVGIKVNDLKSKPYIDLTLETIKSFGLKAPVVNGNTYWFPEASHEQPKQTISYSVEGDWSGGAFLLVAGSIAGPVLVHGLDLASTQADKGIVDAMMSAGAAIAMEAKGIRVQPSALYAFEFDATHCPDLFPPLVALAGYCGGTTTIRGVSRLAHKESNRAITLREEFGKMGVRIDLGDDVMLVHGGAGVNGAHVRSHHDHRIAMACAVAALNATGETLIEDAEAVAKSYPDFYRDLEKLGAGVSLDNKIRLHE